MSGLIDKENVKGQQYDYYNHQQCRFYQFFSAWPAASLKFRHAFKGKTLDTIYNSAHLSLFTGIEKWQER